MPASRCAAPTSTAGRSRCGPATRSAATAAAASCAAPWRPSSTITASRRTGWSATSTSCARSSACRSSSRSATRRSRPRSSRIGPRPPSLLLHARSPARRPEDGDAIRRRSVARVGRYLDHEDDAELIRAANYVFRSRIVRPTGGTGGVSPGRRCRARDAAVPRPGHVLGHPRQLTIWPGSSTSCSPAGLTTRLLDTYQPEREPHVRFITEKAIELGRVQTLA